MATKVLFHSHGNGKHCPDGFAAAWAIWSRLKNNAEYIPCVYQQAPPEIEKGDIIYLVDFSYPREILEAWNEIATVIVFDHHKTAQAELSGLSYAIFDMERSGAQITWGEFVTDHYDGIERREPSLITYIADRDLWKKELPHTEEISRALSIFPQDFKVWDTLANLPNYVDFMRRIGEPLQQKHEAEVEEIAESAFWVEFAGHKVLATNTNRYSLVSDALNVLCKRNSDTSFAVNYHINSDNVFKCELRSIGESDVSSIAKKFGGGGHRNAAGCSIPISEWASVVNHD